MYIEDGHAPPLPAGQAGRRGRRSGATAPGVSVATASGEPAVAGQWTGLARWNGPLVVVSPDSRAGRSRVALEHGRLRFPRPPPSPTRTGVRTGIPFGGCRSHDRRGPERRVSTARLEVRRPGNRAATVAAVGGKAGPRATYRGRCRARRAIEPTLGNSTGLGPRPPTRTECSSAPTRGQRGTARATRRSAGRPVDLRGGSADGGHGRR